MITITLYDSAGNEIPLARAQHRLACANSPCEFAACACAPKNPTGVKIKNPEEPRLRADKR